MKIFCSTKSQKSIWYVTSLRNVIFLPLDLSLQALGTIYLQALHASNALWKNLSFAVPQSNKVNVIFIKLLINVSGEILPIRIYAMLSTF